MGLIRNFINEQKDKKISSMSKEEMLNALKTEKLDEYTVDAIAKSLNIEITNTIDGQKLSPHNSIEGSLDKQHLVRMLAGELVTGDKVIDNDNRMVYNYHTKLFGSFMPGFEGQCYVTCEKDQSEIKITVPAKIMEQPVVALSDPFHSLQIPSGKIELDIQARGIIINQALLSSNIKNIPDFDLIRPLRTDSIRGIPETTSPSYLYNMLRWCKNITPETRIDFITKNYGNYGINGNFATYMAKQEFGIDTKAYLTQEDVDKLNKMVKDAKEATLQQKLTYCAQLSYSARPRVSTDFGHKTRVYFKSEISEKFKINERNIPEAYLATLNEEQMNMSKTMVLQNGVMTSLYLIRTNDNMAMIYNSKTNEVSKAGDIVDGDVKLLNVYSKYEFQEVPKEEYDEILEPLRKEYSQFRDDIANDVLENDNLVVPVTSNEEKEIEEI